LRLEAPLGGLPYWAHDVLPHSAVLAFDHGPPAVLLGTAFALHQPALGEGAVCGEVLLCLQAIVLKCKQVSPYRPKRFKSLQELSTSTIGFAAKSGYDYTSLPVVIVRPILQTLCVSESLQLGESEEPIDTASGVGVR